VLNPAIKQATVSAYEREPERLIPYGTTYAHQFFRAYGFTEEEAADMVRELFRDYMRALEPTDRDATIRVTGGTTINVYETGTGPAWGDTDVVERLYLPGLTEAHQGQYIGLKAMGDSMDPYLRRGDTAVILRDEGAVQAGDFCAVWLADDGCVVKRLVRELPDGTLLLESLNPHVESERFFSAPLGSRVLGKVVRRVVEG